jgi:hypothetical protein
MTGGCPTACAITSREGETGYPVAVVWLPGRRAGLELAWKDLTTSLIVRMTDKGLTDGRSTTDRVIA